jgi:hypothetical protein
MKSVESLRGAVAQVRRNQAHHADSEAGCCGARCGSLFLTDFLFMARVAVYQQDHSAEQAWKNFVF